MKLVIREWYALYDEDKRDKFLALFDDYGRAEAVKMGLELTEQEAKEKSHEPSEN